MNPKYSEKWNDRAVQQLVSYEALFKLIDEIHPLEDVLEVSSKVASQWKYFANVAAWRLVVQNNERYTVIDGSRGQARVETVSLLSSWDTHFMQSRIPALYPVSTLPGSPSPPEHLVTNTVSEISVIPYVKMNTCYGVLTAAASHEPFTDLDKKFIRIFGSHFSSLVYHILMQRHHTDSLLEKANHDFLTGNLNRGAIIERLEIFFPLSKRTKEPLSIILADIDHFKAINDTYGHLVGDQVLKAFSRVLQSQTRASDHLGRYGGEEFLFVLYPCGPKEALRAAERRRTAIENLRVSIPEHEAPIRATMCFGVTGINENDKKYDSILARADAALYEAKNGGRNRCVLKI